MPPLPASGMRREVSKRRTTKISVGRPPPDPLTDGVATVRMPSAEDVERFARYGGDSALLEGIWIAGPPTGADVHDWASELVRELRVGWTDDGGIHGGGLVIDELEPCQGTIGFVPRGNGVVELTYGMAPSARGRGIASRALRLATEWALTEGGFNRVELRIGEDHSVSRRVAEKAGFRFEERFETYVEGIGQIHADVLYSCMRK